MWCRVLGVFVLVAGMGLAGCASDCEERYELAQRDNLELIAERDTMREERGQAVAETEATKSALAANEEEIRRLRAENDRAARIATEWQQKAQQHATAPAAPARDDTSAIEARAAALRRSHPDVHVTPEGNIEITLASDVNFGAGKAELTEAGKKSLRALMPTLTGEFGPYQIRVEGHTDDQPLNKTKPKYGDNFGLGSARSLEVVRFMESELKIAPTRLMSASQGEHHPVAQGKSDAARKQNRRVEIVVIIPRASAVAEAK